MGPYTCDLLLYDPLTSNVYILLTGSPELSIMSRSNTDPSGSVDVKPNIDRQTQKYVKDVIDLSALSKSLSSFCHTPNTTKHENSTLPAVIVFLHSGFRAPITTTTSKILVASTVEKSIARVPRNCKNKRLDSSCCNQRTGTDTKMGQ